MPTYIISIYIHIRFSLLLALFTHSLWYGKGKSWNQTIFWRPFDQYKQYCAMCKVYSILNRCPFNCYIPMEEYISFTLSYNLRAKKGTVNAKQFYSIFRLRIIIIIWLYAFVFECIHFIMHSYFVCSFARFVPTFLTLNLVQNSIVIN